MSRLPQNISLFCKRTKQHYKRNYILQKRQIFWRSLPVIATPYWVWILRHSATGWRGGLKLQISFRKRATDFRALLRKMTYGGKAFFDATPPCTTHMSHTCHTLYYSDLKRGYTHVTHMSHTCHTHVTHMSHTCYTHATHMLHTCHSIPLLVISILVVCAWLICHLYAVCCSVYQ